MLLLSDRQLQMLFENAMDALWITDEQGYFLEANPAGCELLGLSKDHLLRHQITDFIVQGIDFPGLKQELEQQGKWNGEAYLKRWDDTWRRVKYRVVANFTAQGQLWILQDVTCAKRLEQDLEQLNRALEQRLEAALHHSESTNRAIINSLPDLLIQMHRDGRYLQIHKSTGVRLFNPGGIVNGHHVSDHLPPAMAQERLQYIHRALESRCLQVYEYSLEFEDEIRYEEARIMPMDQDTVLLLVRDISDRKKAEITLQEREREFRTLAENAPDGIIRLDRQSRFLYVNPKVEQLTGIPATHFIGKTNQEMGFPEHLVLLWQAALEQVFATAQEQFLETQEVMNSRLETFSSQIVPEFSPDGSVQSVLIISRNISSLKQAQSILIQQAERERLLKTITQRIRQSLNLEEILTIAVNDVRHLLQADRVLIYRFNPDWSGIMIAESVIPPWKVVLGGMIHDPCFTGALVEEYRQGKVHQIDNIEFARLDPCHLNLLHSLEIQSNLAVSIVAGEQLWGLFCVHHCQAPHAWEGWEVELLQQLADQLAIAVQQSELHSQVQRLNITLEQQVQKRTAEVQQALEFEALLKQITDKVRDSLDENQILETVVAELGQRLELQCCDTGIYSSDLTTSTIAHEFTHLLTPAKGTTFYLSEATHAELYPYLFQGQVLQFCDLISCSLRPNQGKLTVLACPIQDDQQVLGDLWLSKLPSDTFNDLEVRLIQQVANQCAIALRQSRLYQSAQTQVNELARLSSLKDDFLSTVSHELRTPMSNIKMVTELLEIHLKRLNLLPNYYPEGTPPPTEIARYFQILKDEGQREINLINDLLDLTRLDAHVEPLTFNTVDLQTWVPHIIEPFMARAKQQQQELNCFLPEELSLFTTDLSYFQRILNELLTNACKYTPPNEEISLSMQVMTETLHCRICNSGVEIPKTEYDRIFDRFYRIPNGDPWKHGGTGLGLTLVKKLVEYLGGTIQVESSHQKTQFLIQLPLYPEG